MVIFFHMRSLPKSLTFDLLTLKLVNWVHVPV